MWLVTPPLCLDSVAKAGAATLWEECFEQDPFDSEVANKYQRVVSAQLRGVTEHCVL